MSVRQKFIVLLAVALAVLLYFAPKLPSEKTSTKVSEANTDFISSFNEAKKSLSRDEKLIFDRAETSFQKAQQEKTEQAWISSANDFLKGARLIQGEKKSVLYKGAIDSYQKALALNSENLSTKTNLGTAIVESSSLLGNQPMQGISLLREVVQKDSTNIDANLQLGLFSVTSQQFDKAIERFKRILRIDSTHIDMYVYLGDTYIQMGDKQKAIANYEKYKAKVGDTVIIRNIDEYIKKLKQTN